MVQRVLDWVFKREREKPDIPVCPIHGGPMQMRGVMGRPTRFSYQTEETYTVIYLLSGSRLRRNGGSAAGDDADSRPGSGAAPTRLRPAGLSGRVGADILVLVCPVVAASNRRIEREEHQLQQASTSFDADAGRVLDNQ